MLKNSNKYIFLIVFLTTVCHLNLKSQSIKKEIDEVTSNISKSYDDLEKNSNELLIKVSKTVEQSKKLEISINSKFSSSNDKNNKKVLASIEKMNKELSDLNKGKVKFLKKIKKRINQIKNLDGNLQTNQRKIESDIQVKQNKLNLLRQKPNPTDIDTDNMASLNNDITLLGTSITQLRGFQMKLISLKNTLAYILPAFERLFNQLNNTQETTRILQENLVSMNSYSKVLSSLKEINKLETISGSVYTQLKILRNNIDNLTN